MKEVTGVIYTNFNVTPCDKKCNFFHFFETSSNATTTRSTVYAFRIKCLFLYPVFCLYIRIKYLFLYLFDHQKYQLLKSILKTNICPLYTKHNNVMMLQSIALIREIM